MASTESTMPSQFNLDSRSLNKMNATMVLKSTIPILLMGDDGGAVT